jgi:hypothetical protein
MPVPPAAVPLYALPPSRFVPERNALARALAAKGDAAAAAVRALRRPVGLAWVLNRLARDRPDDVGALLDAADRLRRGQRRALAGEGADELRAAEADLRGRARALRHAAAPLVGEKGKESALSRLELLLRLAAASSDAREALRAGTLEREPEAQPVELSGLAVLDGGAAGRRARAPGSRPDRAREGAAARAREAALRGARSALVRAEREARRAEAAADRAEGTARRAGERAQALRRRADAARAGARARERALEELGAARGGPRARS